MQWKQGRVLVAFVMGIVLMISLARPARPLGGGYNLIVAVNPQGLVKLKRSNWRRYQPAFIGAALAGKDQLLVAQEAFARVLCQNLSVWTPQAGREYTVSQGCGSTGNPQLQQQDDETVVERATNNPKIPYILEPRNTALFNQKPKLRWNQVEGASSYTVTVRGPGVHWSQETTVSEVVYSGEKPLQPMLRYWLIVTTNQNQSSLSEEPEGFFVLSQDQAQEVLAAKEEVKEKQLDPQSEVLALAHLFHSRSLNTEAIDLLEKEVSGGSSSPAVYQLLGEVYKQIGLNRLARERYLKGLELAQALEDVETIAQVQGGLALTNAIIGNGEEAQNWLGQAKEVYEQLGDQEKASQLEEDIARYLNL
ncbi:MAG: tetratricopeptide repeat protein [Symploca sp. SIO1C4]|uniref:Tetratricopeptide repeat protein n=1 Tax=Symploca sp. SIO1C4 TaxID=2607765 RepID=A0A6B3N1M5_9CYAN|nr:tetratricopeptide repeat protein [Symploca sp. SIO1C4]